MTLHDRIAAEALALVGAPFRLHGRSERTGLDCVGLGALALLRAGVPVHRLPAYRLRGTAPDHAVAALREAGLLPAAEPRPGDILLVRSGPMQLHLMIETSRGLVHAHAGLGRAVLMPPPSPWPLLGRWRCAPREEGS
ncbi:hypothetical protein SLG_33110 [Sphingobium sp. SYK-6]|uniref:hypothetical protein n=1 Tax=Sphingobium sp. (strain NBRC 103272 / SYK-6) TaxID=627192 RepID=UPI0002276FB9|nr:hypothetical protein [Sphingobium sp. SYK-6]BAK67986.1 hypothetical protein SLG_33110 [Sphingobium sp. SYK-6]